MSLRSVGGPVGGQVGPAGPADLECQCIIEGEREPVARLCCEDQLIVFRRDDFELFHPTLLPCLFGVSAPCWHTVRLRQGISIARRPFRPRRHTE